MNKAQMNFSVTFQERRQKALFLSFLEKGKKSKEGGGAAKDGGEVGYKLYQPPPALMDTSFSKA